MHMAISKTEMRLIEKKLDRMETEVRKLRAVLVPTIKISKKERKELENIKKGMAKGQKISGRELVKKLG